MLDLKDPGACDAEAQNGEDAAQTSRYQIAKPKANAASRTTRQRVAIELLIEWQQVFPETFVRFGASRWPPLKVGIAADLAAIMPERDAADICPALFHYTRAVPYLLAHIEGTPRLDLFGQPAGVVTVDQARHAQQLLEGLRRRETRKIKSEPTPQARPSRWREVAP